MLFACVWAFGSSLFTKDNVNYRKEFSSWWKSEHKTVKFPSRGEVFDYFIDLEENKCWKCGKDLISCADRRARSRRRAPRRRCRSRR